MCWEKEKKKKKTAKEHTNNNSQLPVLMSNTSDDCASHASLEFWKKMFPPAWKCLKFWPTAERVRKKKKKKEKVAAGTDREVR